MRSPSALARLCLGFVTARGASSARAQAVQVDPALPAYKAVKGVSGELKSVGSDTMNNQMTSGPRASRRSTRT